jgi:hypothetical protein
VEGLGFEFTYERPINIGDEEEGIFWWLGENDYGPVSRFKD